MHNINEILFKVVLNIHNTNPWSHDWSHLSALKIKDSRDTNTIGVYQSQLKFQSCYGGARVAQWVRSWDLATHTSLSPIWRGFAPSFVNYNKGCTRLPAASDKVYQLLAQGRWFSPASSTTKTGHHDVAEILLKVALNTKIHSILLWWGVLNATLCGKVCH